MRDALKRVDPMLSIERFERVEDVARTSNSGVATIQFESIGQPVTNYQGSLHIDFLEDTTVRIDDDNEAKFGTFPRDTPFIVQVDVDIDAGSASADIVLSGAGAAGAATNQIASAGQAGQFGAVRLWMGFPHAGAFSATNIVVRYEE